jgi:prophage regulatory protein
MVRTRSGDLVGHGAGPMSLEMAARIFGPGEGMARVQRIFRRGEITAITGYNIDYVYELIKQGKFPKPIQLGARAVGWLEVDILKWQQERIARRDEVAA